MSEITQFTDLKPQKIVGIYLTELGHVMAKIKLSNSSHLNIRLIGIDEILPPELAGTPIDLNDWRFVPCCE
jgi:hypothetical protein